MSHPPTPPNVPKGGTDREVPREIRFFTHGVVHRKLTLRERSAIFFGRRNLTLEVHIATEHRPGAIQPIVNVNLTKCLDLESARKELAAISRAKNVAGKVAAEKARPVV